MTCILVRTDLNLTVSNAFEQSAMTIMVTSPLFTARIRWSRIPSKPVGVDCPFLKPEMLGSDKDCSSIEWTSCLSTKRSKTLESAGSIETGRQSAFCFGLSILGTGEMRAVFQKRGNCELEIHTLMICARGPVRKSPSCFIYLTGIWSMPVEQSDRSRLISQNLLIRYRAELERITIGFRR